MKIIILKRDKLGDLLLTTPMLQILKGLYPKAKLSVIAPESSAWILKDAPFIDQLYIYPKPKFFNLRSIASIFLQIIIIYKIRKEQYDVAIAANDTTALTLGMTLAATDVITIYASTSNISFNAFGSEIV